MFLPHFQVADITSTEPFRNEWEVSPASESDTATFTQALAQPFKYIGEGGQAYAFRSADGQYVLKFFKFRRYRPAPFVQALPDLLFLRSYRQNHINKRHRKLEVAFAGYKLAYELHRRESGLLVVQLNPIAKPLIVTIEDKNGQKTPLNLSGIPFVLQRKGEMLGKSLQRFLNNRDIDSAKRQLSQLIWLYHNENQKGLVDIDRGIMHNIGHLDNDELFHLDVGKLSFSEDIKNPEMQKIELNTVASKVQQWLQKYFPLYERALQQHMQKEIDIILNGENANAA